jgi:hypothetical protein
MTQRLPTPGSDTGDWGDILNSFLEVSLASDGTLNSNTVGTNQLASNAVTNAQLDTPTQTTLASVANKYTLPNGGIPYTDLAGNIPASSLSTAVQTNLSSAATAIQPTTTLAGDLSGSLPSPTVAKLQGISLPSSTPTAGQVLQATSDTATNWATVTSSGTVNNATTTTPGLIELAGDLGGTNSSATSPTLANTTNVENIISSNSTVAGATQKTNNLSDLTSVTTARTNLGLGTASTISSTAGGDLSGTLPNPTVAKLQGTTISSPTGGATSYLNATGTWTTPAGGSGNTTSIDGVTVTGTPSSGQVLTATSSSAADWQTLASGSSPLAMSGVISGTTSASTFTNNASAPVDVLNGGGETYHNAGNSGTAATLSLANGNVQLLVLTGNATISLTNPTSNSFRSLLLLLQQDSTGSRTVTWPGSVNWGGPGAPVLTTTASKTDIINLFTVNGGTTWYGAVGIQGY